VIKDHAALSDTQGPTQALSSPVVVSPMQLDMALFTIKHLHYAYSTAKAARGKKHMYRVPKLLCVMSRKGTKKDQQGQAFRMAGRIKHAAAEGPEGTAVQRSGCHGHKKPGHAYCREPLPYHGL